KRIKALEMRISDLAKIKASIPKMTEETKAALLVDQIIKRIEGEIENLKSKIGDMPTQSPKMVPVAVVVISA
ncbi:hypothetical protein, partial [Campylobacter jejuni]|uniref:hypothetical protein n=1 Tax=Campylobacter jejuni TaxID=197 RepID=UPI001E419A03